MQWHLLQLLEVSTRCAVVVRQQHSHVAEDHGHQPRAHHYHGNGEHSRRGWGIIAQQRQQGEVN